jgi:NDP-sugar pyrophosphorylase family protein
MIERSEIGPNVSVGAGSDIRDSRIRHTLIGDKSTIVKADLHDAMLGDRVKLIGFKGSATLGDDSEVTVE